MTSQNGDFLCSGVMLTAVVFHRFSDYLNRGTPPPFSAEAEQGRHRRGMTWRSTGIPPFSLHCNLDPPATVQHPLRMPPMRADARSSNFLRFVQDDSSAIEEPWTIVEMKNRYVSEQRYSPIPLVEC